MKIAFGKHKGEEVENLPTDYIIWLLENCTLIRSLAEELENQLQLREGKGVVRRKDE